MRRFTWVCGTEPVLANEVETAICLDVSPPSAYYQAGIQREADIWADAWTVTDYKWLIMVSDADQLQDWDQLAALVSGWKQVQYLYMVFTSPEPALTRVDGKLAPHLALLRDSSQGQLVVCSHPATEDLITWVQEKLGPTCSATLAHHIIMRCGENLRAILDTTIMARSLEKPLTRQLVDDLTVQIPEVEFTDALIAGDKRTALLAARNLVPEEMGAIIGLLDSRLDTLARLHKTLGLRADEVRTKAGVPQFLTTKYRRHARGYPPESVERRRQVLGVADAGWRGGARDGIAEFIVALW